ncbi:hypothetical protein BDZ45DRAFT_808414 [Acephala macrosclerotiorum]|nr:hypothetical protein BDZ45DRAFT_808414 [Acephala macrosclerotiorum]
MDNSEVQEGISSPDLITHFTRWNILMLEKLRDSPKCREGVAASSFFDSSVSMVLVQNAPFSPQFPFRDNGSLPSLHRKRHRHGPESPTANGLVSSRSGRHLAQILTDASLPQHTIYTSKSPPNIAMPFIAFGNGACQTNGTQYWNFLTEIASHGYVIVADGAPSATATSGFGGAQSTLDDMQASINWANSTAAAKYDKIDTDRILTMGHSCGGPEAMSVAYHNPKVKHIVMFDISIFQDNRRYLLQEIKIPVAWFVGGPKDMGYTNSENDYALLNAELSASKADLDTGYQGTFAATNGGKFGKAVTAYLEWIFRGDTKSKEVCLDAKSTGSLVSDHWNVTYKNWT